MARRLSDARDKAVAAILRLQKEDGHWDVPCETDPSPTAIHLLLRRYLGRPRSELDAALTDYIGATARPEGGWAAYPGGPADPDITVLGYAALKADGRPADDPVLKAAKTAFRNSGGWPATSFYGRLMPAFLGQIPLRALPSVTPALFTLPRWLAFHPERQPMHVRTTVMPLAYLLRKKAVRRLPEERGIVELADRPENWTIWPTTVRLSPSLKRLRKSAEVLGRLSRWADRLSPPADWGRRVVARISGFRNIDGTFGGFFLSTVLGLMALDNIPGTVAAEFLATGLTALEEWIVDEPRGARQKFLPSAVASAAVALQALQAAGIPIESPPVRKAAEWLVRHQSRRRGPWAGRVRAKVTSGGWAFGVQTDLFPECDTTAIVLRALTPHRRRYPEAFDRGVGWLLALQNRNGGWAAWDRGNRSRILFPSGAFVPYQDLPDPEITARVLFALGPLARNSADGRLRRSVRRALAFLWRAQRPDGTWPGNWIVNFAAGTSHALQGLKAAGVSPRDSRFRKAMSWLYSVQNPDGGWGESKASYRTGRFEPGTSNAFVTAAVLRALLAAGERGGEAFLSGFEYLLQTQHRDGLWTDPEWNGIALPGKIYLRYEIVPSSVAILAISGFLEAVPRAFS